MVLPFELWTAEITARFEPTAEVAVTLLHSVYRHPSAGKLWQEHFAKRLTSLGGEKIPGHPSNSMFWTEGEIMILKI